MRLPPAGWTRRARALAMAGLASLVLALSAGKAGAQPTLGSLPGRGQPGQPGGQMILQADQIVYDNDRLVVIAEGGVQIFYNGNTVLARRVLYYRQTRRLVAEGGVRVTDAQGNVTNAETADLSEDLRDGFVRSLRLEQTRERTRMSADTAERREGGITILERGTYTACEPCRDDPTKPPLWQVRAARIIHNQSERRIYYENGALEFFGVPVAWLPYFWSSDGSAKRESGFLFPQFSRNSRVGSGYGVPYYWAISPFYDLTVTPTWMTRQGLHVTADWRHALPFGSYRVRASGIRQQEPEKVGTGFSIPGAPDPGAREWRGGIESWGEFRLTDRWTFGWNVAADSDPRYFQDYSFAPTSLTERVSTAYLRGLGERSFFETRAYYLRTYVHTSPQIEQQAFMPWVAPVTDYATVLSDPWVGGEFRLNSNFVHISRTDAMAYRFVDPTDPARTLRWLTPGFAGDYTRLSIDAQWRRTFTDPIGQRWTPFLRVRGDVYNVDPSGRDYLTTDITGSTLSAGSATPASAILPDFFRIQEQVGFRGMPAVGLDYRYPFIATTPEASHLIEPIAQVILRPNETRIGALPNEDAQSLVFDDTNLFSVSKFSGYDRVEGGSRANIGVQYTLRTTEGFLASALFGQSYHLAGLNSFAFGARDISGTGLDSGLETDRSDYVARLHVQPWAHGDVTARFRFDTDDFTTRRMDIAGSVYYGPATLSTAYTFIAAQPQIGFTTEREFITLGASLRLAENWTLYGAGSYNLSDTSGRSAWVSNQLGLRYADDCFILSLDYINVYSGYGDTQPQQRIMARLSLRTIGDFTLGRSLGTPN